MNKKEKYGEEDNKIENQKGITLLVLVIMIIVLLILAGITIGAITGDNGIIGNAGQAKEESEIANEKEIVNTATVQAMGNNKYGNIEQNELQEQLNKITGDGKTEVNDLDDEFEVAFIESKRYYIVDKDGNVGDVQQIVDDESPGILTGSGTKENPYVIRSIEDLVVFSNMTNGAGMKLKEDGTTEEILEEDSFTGKYVILDTTLNFKSKLSYVDSKRKDFGDINKNGVVEELREELMNSIGFTPINNFSGYFNGNNYEIQNIYINRDTEAGLFVGTNYIEKIENIGITGNITSMQSNAVGICTYSNIIENCWNKANITSEGGNVAGICRCPTSIKNCYNTGDVITTGTQNRAGGICCDLSVTVGTIENCYNKGDITGTLYTGGIAAGNVNKTTIIINCYNEGDISGISNVGGILGTSGENIENCYNHGNVKASGNSYGGGIVGSNSKIINHCYNKGNISGNYVGGIEGAMGARK